MLYDAQKPPQEVGFNYVMDELAEIIHSKGLDPKEVASEISRKRMPKELLRRVDSPTIREYHRLLQESLAHYRRRVATVFAAFSQDQDAS